MGLTFLFAVLSLTTIINKFNLSNLHFLFNYQKSLFSLFIYLFWSLHAGGMASMIGLPSDRALTDDNECLRFCLS